MHMGFKHPPGAGWPYDGRRQGCQPRSVRTQAKRCTWVSSTRQVQGGHMMEGGSTVSLFACAHTSKKETRSKGVHYTARTSHTSKRMINAAVAKCAGRLIRRLRCGIADHAQGHITQTIAL
eukprot:1136973-Pelagomonas_calceolata.AAC.7